MPLSSGKIWISGVSGKCRSWRGMRPSAGGSSGAGRRERARQLVLDELDRLAIRRIRVRRVVQRERVERVAVARRVDLRVEDRQARAAEEAADAGEQRLLVGQVDERLQAGAVARQAHLDDGGRAVDAPVEVPRMPGDLVGRVALKIERVELAPQPRFGVVGHRVKAQQPMRFALALCDAVVDRALARAGSSAARAAWNRSSSSLPFHAFHTLGLVPRMSATVSRYSAIRRRSSPILAANASTTAGSVMSCFCAVSDIVRCSVDEPGDETRRLRSISPCCAQKRCASRAPSVEWSPPRPFAMSWKRPAR